MSIQGRNFRNTPCPLITSSAADYESNDRREAVISLTRSLLSLGKRVEGRGNRKTGKRGLPNRWLGHDRTQQKLRLLIMGEDEINSQRKNALPSCDIQSCNIASKFKINDGHCTSKYERNEKKSQIPIPIYVGTHPLRLFCKFASSSLCRHI